LIAWLPLALLTTLRPGHAGAAHSFIRDVEVNVRFLVALPVLIAGEVIIHRRLRFVLRSFVQRGLIRPDDMPAYNRALQSAMRLRDSVWIEAALILGVYVGGIWLWGAREPVGGPTWYSTTGARWDLTPAGYWYVFLSIPIFQVNLLRWYLRLVIWWRLLWQIARLNLQLVPIHPDRCGGMSFLGRGAFLFGPILFAEGAVLAGVIGNRVLNAGDSVLTYKFYAAGAVVFCLLIILGPLVMFTPALLRSKRAGFGDYGVFSASYVDAFEQKWIQPPPAYRKSALGSADIQSLADLSNSYAIVREMRVVPFSTQDMINLAAVTLAPLIPLVLTVIPAKDLFARAIKLLL